MKVKMTRKQARECFSRVFAARGHADPYLSCLLGDPDYYFTQVDGWACDAWEFGNDIITAGYAPFGKEIGSYEYFRGWYKKADCNEVRYDPTGKKLKTVRKHFRDSLRNLINKL